MGSPVAVVGGVATYTTSALAVGTQAITAQYSGDATTALRHRHGQPGCEQHPHGYANQFLAESFDLRIAGHVLDLGQLQWKAPSPTGTVTFFDGATNIGSSPVATTASTTNLLPYSQNTTQATWGPYCGSSANQSPATAPDGSLTATQIVLPSSFTCGSGNSWGTIDSIVGGLQAGTVYTVSAWLRGGAGGEVVSFGLEDGTWLNTITLTTSWQRYSFTFPAYSPDGESNRGFEIFSQSADATYYLWGAQTEARSNEGPYVATYGASTASGTGSAASFTTPLLTAGTHSITAVYSGDSTWNGSTSPVLPQVVNKANSVLSVVSSLNPSVFGNTVTFTLTVAGSGAVPTGTVTLTLGGTTLLPATVLNGAGQATYTTSTLPTGADTLTLSYSGNSNYY